MMPVICAKEPNFSFNLRVPKPIINSPIPKISIENTLIAIYTALTKPEPFIKKVIIDMSIAITI
jgi:hypothetical protein